MINKIKQVWKTLFIANALPFIAIADKFSIHNSSWVVIAALPGTVFTCIIFTLPLTVYQAWYEYKLSRSKKYD